MGLKKKISILGAGQAGAYAASEIRKHDKESEVTIFSEENYLPYERPPLSKDSIMGKKNFKDLTFFSRDFYEKENINIRYQAVQEVDFDEKILISRDDQCHSYDSLLIATGSKNRKLSFSQGKQNLNDNILYLRNIEDSKKIKKIIQKHHNFAIVGGGFIGLEIASSISQLGKVAHVIEMGTQVMGRVIPSQIASLVAKYHEDRGNSIFVNSSILSIKKIDQEYLIELNNNKKILVDFVIAGIGSVANVDLFINSSLKLENGIVTDEFCRTSVKDVFAAGDVSNFYHPLYDTSMRLESYQHAQNHGIAAARNLLGQNFSYNNIPWMWSDQFDLNLQLTGICNDFDNEVQRGDSLEEGIIYFYLKKKKIMGACGIGIAGKVGRDIRLAGKISETNVEIDLEDLKNKKIKLNNFLKKIN